jgi:uncharacterized protein (TIGR00159 family)
MGFQINIKDIIDILLVAFLLYQTYRLIRGTSAVNIFIGVIAFIIGWFLVSVVFKMQLLGAILDGVMSVGAIALIVIFQNEIRRFFSLIGTRKNWKLIKWLYRVFEIRQNEMENITIMHVVIACKNMARTRSGALIVIANNSDMTDYIQSGEVINSIINSRLIENIFFKNSPLHDGAMIISDKEIIAVGCILPVSQSQEIPKRLGLRHRAALGISEKTDAMAIVISEESGRISVAKNGELLINISAEQLERLLSKQPIE